jgi:hypothetical protein
VTPVSGSGGGGGASPEPESTPPLIPDPVSVEPVSPTEVSTPEQSVLTTTGLNIPGYSPPKTIKKRGTTILVPNTLRTTDGQRVFTRATVAISQVPRKAPTPKSIGAQIIKSPNGSIRVKVSGRQALVIKLILSTKQTPTYPAVREVTTWRLPAW